MPKGGQYEREICRTVSLWLTNQRDDDQVWRSSQSGGRATQREKKGKKTKGHAGDICATGKHGRRLLKLVTLEIKRGYNSRANSHACFDLRPKNDKVCMYEDWFWQTHLASTRADTPHWWLIHRRDGRRPVIFMPFRLWNVLFLGTGLDQPTPFLQMSFYARRGFKPAVGRNKGAKGTKRFFAVVGMVLDDFLSLINPADFFDRVRSST